MTRLPTRTEGSLTATVFQTTPAQILATTPYQFDNFYTFQGAGLYAEQLKAMLNDPGFVATVFDRARLNLPARRLSQAGRVFTVKKLDPAVVQVFYDDTDRDRVVNILTTVGQQLASATTSLQEQGAISQIQLEVTSPYVMSYHRSVLLASVLAGFASAFLALGLIFLIEFARPRTK